MYRAMLIEICDDDQARHPQAPGGRVLAVNSQTRTLTLTVKSRCHLPAPR